MDTDEDLKLAEFEQTKKNIIASAESVDQCINDLLEIGVPEDEIENIFKSYESADCEN